MFLNDFPWKLLSFFKPLSFSLYSDCFGFFFVECSHTPINVQLELPCKLTFPIKCTLQVHDAKHVILEKGRCSCSYHLLTGFCFMLKIYVAPTWNHTPSANRMMLERGNNLSFSSLTLNFLPVGVMPKEESMNILINTSLSILSSITDPRLGWTLWGLMSWLVLGVTWINCKSSLGQTKGEAENLSHYFLYSMKCFSSYHIIT